MFRNQKVIVVMPAFNAARTLLRTYEEIIEQGIVDDIIIVDDGSRDETIAVATGLPGVRVFAHDQNLGYGANQKTCYRKALDIQADIVILLHPDYQYTPKLIPAMVALVGNGLYPCVLGSRVLGGKALKGGMPLWRYMANRLLTVAENLLLGSKLSEFHTGYRAFSGRLLQEIPFEKNSDDFVFDNQILAQVLWAGYSIGEVSCPASYSPEASSLGFFGCIQYGLGCLHTALRFRLAALNLIHVEMFPTPRKP